MLAIAIGGSGCARSISQLQVHVAPEHRDAELYVDGHLVGTVGELQTDQAGLPSLAPGEHRVEVRKPGFFPYQRSVHVARRHAMPVIEVEAELLGDPEI